MDSYKPTRTTSSPSRRLSVAVLGAVVRSYDWSQLSLLDPPPPPRPGTPFLESVKVGTLIKLLRFLNGDGEFYRVGSTRRLEVKCG